MFEETPAILLAFCKPLSTAQFLCTFQRISATSKQLLKPPNDSLFGGAIECDYQLKKPPPPVYTTEVWCEKIKISLYMARPWRQEELIAWLDDQEQKPFLRVAPIDETVETFDPLHRRRGADDFAIPARIEEIYDRGQRGLQGRGAGMRRTRKWRFAHELKKPLVPQMMNKIK